LEKNLPAETYLILSLQMCLQFAAAMKYWWIMKKNSINSGVEEVTNNLLGHFGTTENFEQVLIQFNWRLTTKDEDDNKFVDT
jgi:hypothetical protein